ncbi:transmembrane protein 65 [Palaemon carinicauda]|uniref:transmembrane protein 65 n=1 Tax=Palaemon carinicauda TaxID=392227 RepID=UPI0035B5FE89
MLTGKPVVAFPSLILRCLRDRVPYSSSFYVAKNRISATPAIGFSTKADTTVVTESDKNEEILDGSIQGNTPTYSKDTVVEFVSSLSTEQRVALLEEIHKVQATEVMKKAEEKLASWRWRSRFGRPSSVHQLGADPTGTYCEIPQDWLQKKVAEKAKPGRPTVSELRKLAIFNALPFVGFGFLDNLIMIVAGDYIDTTIGVGLGISTMAAAALGNTVSDLAGIGSAWYVENIAVKIGIKPPNLCHEQLEMTSARWSSNIGRGAGVVLGCLLGMFPLLFLNQQTEKKEVETK